jgi:hypothetical protein
MTQEVPEAYHSIFTILDKLRFSTITDVLYEGSVKKEEQPMIYDTYHFFSIVRHSTCDLAFTFFISNTAGMPFLSSTQLPYVNNEGQTR